MPAGEDRNYGDKFSPPWSGRAHQITHMYQQLTLVYDDNSSLMISFEHLFETEEEAYLEYAKHLRTRMKEDRLHLTYALDRLRNIRVRRRDRQRRVLKGRGVP